jgi:two-component system response regulator NreC
MKIRLLLVDDHAVVRSGLRMLMASEEDMEIVGEAGNAREAINAVYALKPDVVLMDIGLPDMSGIEVTREIKRLYPDVAVVALTIHEDEEYFFKMLEDYLSQDQPVEKRSALSGLTDREQEVLHYLAEGNSNDEIAGALVISPKTVARHRENIMRKLNLHSRADLVRYAIRKGIIQA